MKTKLLLALLLASATALVARAQTTAPAPAPQPVYQPQPAPQPQTQSQLDYQQPAKTVGWFFRLGGGYVKPATAQYSGSGYGDLAFGVLLGRQQEHEIGLDIAITGWSAQSYVNRSGRVSGTNSDRLPFLITYRYYFRNRSIVSPYIGVGAGFETVSFGSGHYYYNDPDSDSGYDDYGYNSNGRYNSSNRSVFAAAGNVGIAIALARSIDLDIGYRIMWADVATNTIYPRTTGGTRLTLTNGSPAGWASFVGAAFNFHF